MNLSIDRPSSEQRSEFACENAFQQPLGDRERAPERYEVDEQVKMEVRDLDLHYGDFHALKNEDPDHELHRSLGLRQVDAPEDAQSYERSC